MKRWCEYEQDNWRFAVDFIKLTKIDKFQHDLPLDLAEQLRAIDSDWLKRTSTRATPYGIFGLVVSVNQKWATSLFLRQHESSLQFTIVSWWEDKIMVCSEAAFDQMLAFAFYEESFRGHPALFY